MPHVLLALQPGLRAGERKVPRSTARMALGTGLSAAGATGAPAAGTPQWRVGGGGVCPAMPSVVGLCSWRSEMPGLGRAISTSFSAQGPSVMNARAPLRTSCPCQLVCLELPMPSVVPRLHVVSAPHPSRHAPPGRGGRRLAGARSTASHRGCECALVWVVLMMALPSVVQLVSALTCG